MNTSPDLEDPFYDPQDDFLYGLDKSFRSEIAEIYENRIEAGVNLQESVRYEDLFSAQSSFYESAMGGIGAEEPSPLVVEASPHVTQTPFSPDRLPVVNVRSPDPPQPEERWVGLRPYDPPGFGKLKTHTTMSGTRHDGNSDRRFCPLQDEFVPSNQCKEEDCEHYRDTLDICTCPTTSEGEEDVD